MRRFVHLAIAVLFLTACARDLAAQGSDSSLFPLPLGPTNAGKEFWLSFPTNWDVAQAAKKYIRLYITSNVRTKVDISAGAVVVKTLYTVPFDIVTADLSASEAQVVVRDDQTPVPPDQVYPKYAIHIVAGAPVVVYGLNRTSFTSDGLLALPTNALGKEYIVASAADIADGANQKLPSQFVIIAPYDSTTVRITNPMNSPNHVADSAFTIVMDRGDVFSSMSSGVLGDLSGALIEADKPVAVTAGQNCTYLPNSDFCCCDHLEEMLLPVSSWGKFYQSVPYADRIKGDLYRIFAGADSATIYINGIRYGMLAKKGGPNGIGWFEYLPPQRGAVEVSSDKPISVAQYNNSQSYDNTQTDPFYIVLMPLDQYQKQIVFTTPQMDYPINYINLVCDSVGYDSLEIALGGSGAWENVRSKFGAARFRFPTQINGRSYVGTTLRIDPGTYRLRGTMPFAAYIYGSSDYDSYGYPLAALVADRSTGDSLAPDVLRQLMDTLGSVHGTIKDLPTAPSSRSNLSSVDLDPVMSKNYLLSTDPFEPGVASNATYTLTVMDRSKDADAIISAVDMAGNVTYDTVHYTAPASTSSVPISASTLSDAAFRILSSNPVTGDKIDLTYDLPAQSVVSLSLFDAGGAMVRNLLNKRAMGTGHHVEAIPVADLPSGLYLIRLTVNGKETGRSVILAR